MAHWFHRNPLKASKPQSFDALKNIAKSVPASKLCGEMRVSRAKILQQLADSRNTHELIEKSVNEYLSLLLGLCEDVVPQPTEGDQVTNKSGESKLRKIEVFKWTNTICGSQATALPDAYYEMISMVTELALWHTKRASYLASNESLGEDDAKEVFKHLRMAAGIFIQAKNMSESKLGTGLVEKHGDTDARVLDGISFTVIGRSPRRGKGWHNRYWNEFSSSSSNLQDISRSWFMGQPFHTFAETESEKPITVARAVELKHKPSTITAVALGTSELFQKADESLRSVDPKKAGKWRKYLQIKKNIYLAYAHSFKGEGLLNEDQCGQAIKSLQEAEKCYTMAGMLCKEYSSTKGPGTSVRPSEHQFFRRLGPIIKQRLEKATHENGFIYHQRIPAEVPELESTAIGIAAPIEFAMPTISPRWKPEIFKAFDAGNSKPQMTGHDEEKLDPVKEVDDPNNKSNNHETGCVIS